MTHCPRCNATLPQPPERFCPSCGADLAVATPAPGAPPPLPAAAAYGGGTGGGWGAPPPGGGGSPWDRREQLGFGSALVETTQMLYTDPTAFFRSMATSGGLMSPLIYAVILGYVGLVASTVYNVVMRSVMGTGFLSQLDPEVAARLSPFLEGGGVAGVLVNLLLGPVILAIVVFIMAGIYHLALMLLGGASSGFEATFRVACFANAAALLQIVPVCGQILSLIWTIVLLVIGLSEAHRVSKGKAVAAVLLPLVLCCCCFIAGIFGIVSMAASSAR